MNITDAFVMLRPELNTDKGFRGNEKRQILKKPDLFFWADGGETTRQEIVLSTILGCSDSRSEVDCVRT